MYFLYTAEIDQGGSGRFFLARDLYSRRALVFSLFFGTTLDLIFQPYILLGKVRRSRRVMYAFSVGCSCLGRRPGVVS